MKLMLSWLNTEFKQLFTLCTVKFGERDITSYIKPVFCKAHQHGLFFGNATWRQLKISTCLKLNKYRNVPVILLNWGAEILIIKRATWRGFLWEQAIWFSDPVLNSICWSKKSYREKMRERLLQSCALDSLPTEWKCGIFFLVPFS